MTDHTATDLVKAARRRGPGLFLRGVAMGTADVIPGVSGGTIALITGIYDELVATIAGVDGRLVRALLRGRPVEALGRLNASFLAPLLLGIGGAIVTLARLITHLLDTHPQPVWGFLTGLIVASTLVVARQVRGWTALSAVALVAGGGLGYGVTLAVPLETGTAWWQYTLAGGIASVAMILPGISGSFILVLVGKYQQVLGAVNERDLYVVTVFGLGFAAGILAFSRVLQRLLARHHTLTMAFLVGLMAGSMRKVWPFRQYTPMGEGGLEPASQFDCVLPQTLDGSAYLALALIAAGMAVVAAIEWLAQRRSPAP
ncbi:MAG: DUF368 domain-containing protein [Gemmatimonadota bacterium]